MIAQTRLGEQLRWLYEQGEPDPIAVILGATSLENAIEGLDSISRAARATESVLAAARTSRTRLTIVRSDLARRVERTKAARARVTAAAADLERSRSERTGYIEQLRREQALTATQITSLERRAQAAQAKALQVTEQARAAPETATAAVAGAEPTPATTTTGSTPRRRRRRRTTTAATTTTTTPTTAPETPAGPSEPPPPPVESVSDSGTPTPTAVTAPPRPGGTMSVLATGYCLRGTTATGLPVGPGIVAVDPTVIPLGTRMTVPGYGEGVAADVGGAVQGARIDVWIASCSQAAAFTRTVTIIFH